MRFDRFVRMLTVKHISISIARSPAEVYAFTSQLDNLSKWAGGVSSDMKIAFAPKNDFGVLDHDVTLPDGTSNHNAMRVIPNGKGSEVVFSLFRDPAASDADYAKDAQHIETDLKKLKQLLER